MPGGGGLGFVLHFVRMPGGTRVLGPLISFARHVISFASHLISFASGFCGGASESAGFDVLKGAAMETGSICTGFDVLTDVVIATATGSACSGLGVLDDVADKKDSLKPPQL